MTDTASVFAEIVKTAPQEDGSLLVQGRASDSSLDLDQQICDPTWLKKAMPEWFKIGNVREQHDPRRAVGKATEYDAREDGHFITARIVDPVAKAKTEAGIFTGFSIGVKGPRIAKSAAAPGGVIHDGKIIEVSLVDRPANPNSTLTLVKSAAPGWEGKPDDLDDERGLVHVEELHLAETAGEDAVTKADDACPVPDVAAVPELDDATADAVLGIDALASFLDIPEGEKAAVLAAAIEKGAQASDIAGAKDAIATIGGLIASEAADLVTCPSEAYDIQLLLEAVRALQRFIRCEEDEERRRDGEERPELAMGATADLWKRKWSQAERKRAAKEGHARPDGSFPIETAEDVAAAVHLAKSPEEQAWVKRRAKAVGADNKIPDTWKGAMSDTTTDKASAGDADADANDQPTTPKGGDPAVEQAQPPSMDEPGDQADPDDGEAEKGGKPSGKPFGKPDPDKTGKGEKPTGDSDDEDDDEDGEGGATKADSPDLVKALTTALTDTDSELRKTLSAIVEDSTKSTADQVKALGERLEQVERMAAPGGPALRRTADETATARQGDLRMQAEHFKALAESAEDPDLRRGYHTKAAALDAELRTLATALAAH